MIRPATKDDIDSIYPLISIIWKDMSFPLLNLLDDTSFKATMLSYMALKQSKFSYTNAWVYEENRTIIGVLYGYPGDEEDKLNNHFYTFIDTQFPHLRVHQYPHQKETHDKEWYLDAIVVHQNYRNKGIGKAFFNHIHTISYPYTTIGLNCNIHNIRAKLLYEKLGFQPKYQTTFLNHTYWHMEKQLVL